MDTLTSPFEGTFSAFSKKKLDAIYRLTITSPVPLLGCPGVRWCRLVGLTKRKICRLQISHWIKAILIECQEQLVFNFVSTALNYHPAGHFSQQLGKMWPEKKQQLRSSFSLASKQYPCNFSRRSLLVCILHIFNCHTLWGTGLCDGMRQDWNTCSSGGILARNKGQGGVPLHHLIARFRVT